MAWKKAAAIVLALLVPMPALIGCGGASAPEAREPGEAPVAVADAKAAPEFELRDLSGESVRLSDSDGRVRLLDFWATWCAPCREEIPMLNELEELYSDHGLEIMAISDPEEGAEVVRGFVDEHGVSYRNLIGTDKVTVDYRVMGLPTAFLIDREGRIVESFLGPKPRKPLERKIRELLGLEARG